MRKTILLFPLTLAMLTLASCSKGSTDPDKVPDSYTADVRLTTNGREFSATLVKSKNDWQFEFTEPETIKGMKLSSDGDSFTAELEKLKFIDDIKNLSENSPPRLIVKALSMCESGKGMTAEKKNGKTVNTGTIEGADLSVTFDNGKPVSMEIGGEIAVTFEN
ncbi:MAG: hypothetical protein IJ555_09505, partial [Ruminococcus sp.]|nr:hypothetical protein [Ruminococcus sp.]